MRRRGLLRTLAVGAATLALPPKARLAQAGGASAPVAGSRQFSAAENLLFEQNDLGALPRKATLEYSFTKRGSLEEPFDDTATVAVGAPEADGGRPVDVNFLSGARHVALPAISDARGNPVILYFLERDVQEMHRLTGGSALYFRNRMRHALAESATVRNVKASAGATTVEATEIRMSPFDNDPGRVRYARYANKSYVFTLSNEVPGKVLEMRSEMRDAPQDGGAPGPVMISEVLRFQRMR